MKKHFVKIFASASVVVAAVLIVVLLVTAFGGIKPEDFDNELVKGLLVTLGILYFVLVAIALSLLFLSDDVVKEVTMRSEQEGSSKVTVSVIRKLVKSTGNQIEGVKVGKVALVSNEYGVRLKVAVKVVDKDVIETELYIRTMLEKMFKDVLGFKFHAIEIKITALQPATKIAPEDVKDKVQELFEEKKSEEVSEAAVELTEEADEAVVVSVADIEETAVETEAEIAEESAEVEIESVEEVETENADVEAEESVEEVSEELVAESAEEVETVEEAVAEEVDEPAVEEEAVEEVADEIAEEVADDKIEE